MPGLPPRGALALGVALALAAVPAAARAPAPRPTVGLESAELHQSGETLVLDLRLTAPVPAEEPRSDRGRRICLTFTTAPAGPARRRVCLARTGARLIARAAPARGTGFGLARAVGGYVRADGPRLTVRFRAARAGLDLGRVLHWRAAVTWFDGGACERVAAATCTEQRTGRLPTRTPDPLRGRRPLRLLVTGDSEIQIVDGILDRRLTPRGVRLRSDARVGTGLTKPWMLDWRRHATRQARALRPDVTVVFLGANDGYPLAGRRCCDPVWVAEYANRVRTMMRAYARAGRGLVYWVVLPTPRRRSLAAVVKAVNEGIRLAARDLPDDVRLLDFERVFTPGRVFRQRITFRGRRIDARQADGTHLSDAGAGVAASLIAEQLRRDGFRADP